MARPPKQSLTYFPLDVIVDSKIKLIEAKFGLKGFATVIKLFQHIYGEEGYYCKWDEESRWLFSSDILKITEGNEYIEDFTSIAIDRGLFDQEIFEEYEILTSRGIQERYFEAVKRRSKILIDERILLVKVDQILQKCNNNSINVDNNSEIVDDNATNNIKEDKNIKNKTKQNHTTLNYNITKQNYTNKQEFFSDSLCSDLTYRFNKELNQYGISRKNSFSQKEVELIHKTMENHTVDDFEKVLKIVEYSKFLKGESNANFKISFMWIFKEDNFGNILNGCYSNKKDLNALESTTDFDALDEIWASENYLGLDKFDEEELLDD